MRVVYHDESQLAAEWQGVAQGQSLVSLPTLGTAMVKSHLPPAEIAKIDILHKRKTTPFNILAKLRAARMNGEEASLASVDSSTVACHRSPSTVGSQ